MKIAVPISKDKKIDDHFGHCEHYSIFAVSDEKKIDEVTEIRADQGCGCKSGIAAKLARLGVDIMLAGGIGGGAIRVLNEAGIEVIRGCSGDASTAVKQYLEGHISDNGVSCQQHRHHHGSGHQCSN